VNKVVNTLNNRYVIAVMVFLFLLGVVSRLKSRI